MNNPEDLISRTAAIKAFTGKPPEYYHTSYIVGELNCVPTVDAASVVHGRWIKYEPDMHGMEPLACSVCNYLFARLYPQNYCPNCGAKMND